MPVQSPRASLLRLQETKNNLGLKLLNSHGIEQNKRRNSFRGDRSFWGSAGTKGPTEQQLGMGPGEAGLHPTHPGVNKPWRVLGSLTQPQGDN